MAFSFRTPFASGFQPVKHSSLVFLVFPYGLSVFECQWKGQVVSHFGPNSEIRLHLHFEFFNLL